MPSFHETRRLPYTPAQMFDLVADVARYREFLPWVAAVRIRSDSDTDMVAELAVGFMGLRERFTSHVAKQRPDTIHVDYLDGPLEHLRNEWRFRDDGAGGCLLDVEVDFRFRSRLLDGLAGQVFDRAARRMIAAFETRAARLYGAAASGSNSSSAHSAA